MHPKHLDHAANLNAWLKHHEETIRLAKQTPMTYTSFPDSVGNVVSLSGYLRVDDATVHDIVVSGVIALCESHIADIQEELALFGVTDKPVVQFHHLAEPLRLPASRAADKNVKPAQKTKAKKA